MMGSASPHKRMIIATLLAGAALLAVLWMLALAPKRSESAKVRTDVVTQEQRLSTAQTELASYRTAHKHYRQLFAELQRLGKAVPAHGAIPALLRQLQRRARALKSDLSLVALKSAAAAPGSNLTPGATIGAGGLATLPFSFAYSGRYFDLVHVLAAARRAVSVKSGDLTIDGRLVTIEGLSFQRAAVDSSLIKASVSGTAYIATETATPAQPAAAPAAASTQGGS
jgi:Tfp pilus assembly protein PilO